MIVGFGFEPALNAGGDSRVYYGRRVPKKNFTGSLFPPRLLDRPVPDSDGPVGDWAREQNAAPSCPR